VTLRRTFSANFLVLKPLDNMTG